MAVPPIIPFNGLNQPLPFPDALQEFKVETSSVGAQTGQHASASVTVATRSGTNSLHGNVFEYTRNYLFNGRSATALVRDSLKQNQFGGTIGGPIIKNRLFYFVGEQSHDQAVEPRRIPGLFDDARDADRRTFRRLLPPSARPSRLRWRLRSSTTSFPQSLMDPIAMKIAKLLPTTGQLNACGLINYATGGNQRQYQIPVKVDYTFNAKHSMFVRYMLSNNYTPLFYDPTNPLFTGSTTGQSNNIQSMVIGDTYRDQPDAGQQLAHRDEPQRQPPVHSRFQDSRRFRDSHQLLSSPRR